MLPRVWGPLLSDTEVYNNRIESELMPTVCTVERSGYGSILTANSVKFAGDGVQLGEYHIIAKLRASEFLCITNIAIC